MEDLNAGGTAGIRFCPVPEYVTVFRGGFSFAFSRDRKTIQEGKEKCELEMISGVRKKETVCIREILEKDLFGTPVKMNGAVHTIRDMGEVAFVILRKADGLVQCVFEEGVTKFDLKNLKEESAVEITGIVTKEQRAPHGFEIRLEEIRILSEPAKAMPIAISKYKMNTSLETKLSLRPISLRNVRERAKFKIQEGLVRGFRDYLHGQGFTEIHTPKIVARGAEGGSNVFKLDYFNKKAELGQSPQFYKQTMVGVYDRVFEAAPVFRAEKHNTTRHLNEYVSLDFEMGYIDGFEDIMEMEAGFLKYTFELLEREYEKELKMLDVTLPRVDFIPAVRFDKAKELVAGKYNRKIRTPYDLEPEEELLIGQYVNCLLYTSPSVMVDFWLISAAVSSVGLIRPPLISKKWMWPLW